MDRPVATKMKEWKWKWKEWVDELELKLVKVDEVISEVDDEMMDGDSTCWMRMIDLKSNSSES